MIVVVGERRRGPGPALAPDTPSGRRIRAILGPLESRYVNLLPPGDGWDAGEARRAWRELALPEGCGVLLLGAKVARAVIGSPRLWRDGWLPSGQPWASIPHPSGRCRAWLEVGARTVARALAEGLVERAVRGRYAAWAAR